MPTSRDLSTPVATLPGVGEVATLLAEAIVASDHPQIASVQIDPSGPAGWCRVKVGFADGSTAFIGTSR